MDDTSESKLRVVDAEMSRLSITAKSTGKLPESTIPSTIPLATSAVTVTIEELPIPSSPPIQPASPDTPPEPTPDDQPQDANNPSQRFTPFPYLPAELRLKIWHFSFLLATRTIELHTRRTHYADNDRDQHNTTGAPKWQSDSRNPAALSVNAEARFAAQEFYNVRLPLAYSPLRRSVAGPSAIPHSYSMRGMELHGDGFTEENWSWTQHVVRERPGDLMHHSDRVLYMNLEVDMVVLLGDLHFGRLSRLLSWFKGVGGGKGKGKGLRRLGMSVAPWSHTVGAATLKAFARTVFADVEEFVLFMYMGRMPPEEWDGGKIVLEECRQDDNYRRFLMGRGGQFREGDGWMVVGKRPLEMVEIRFESGW